MNTLRKILLLIIIAGSATYSARVYLTGPCDAPLSYRLGDFAPKFGISQTDFVSAIEEAEALWETESGKDLFVYSEVGDMPVNLIFDERQATVQKNKTLQNKISQVTGSADEIKSQLDTIKIDYARAQVVYESMSKEFKRRQDAHIANVNYWNGKGGAPAPEYEKMSQEGAALKVEYNVLDQKRAQVNELATQLNGLVGSYNGLVKNINSNVAVINESADKEFEQGEYVSDAAGARINIYEFTDRKTLVRVLAHELGHALGIDHNTNPDSIMYYLNGSENMIPTTEDIADLNIVCKFKPAS